MKEEEELMGVGVGGTPGRGKGLVKRMWNNTIRNGSFGEILLSKASWQEYGPYD